MMKVTKTIKAKADLETLRAHCQTTWRQPGDFNVFAQEHMYLLTCFVRAGSTEMMKRQFREKYFAFLKRLFGRNVGRKLHVQPVGFAYLDFDGTRRVQSTSKLKPHFHALMVIHPATKQQVGRMIAEADPMFAGAEPYRPHPDHGMMYVATYAMKGIIGDHGYFPGGEDEWMSFPFRVPKTSAPWTRKGRLAAMRKLDTTGC
jgi:hypothetical protein